MYTHQGQVDRGFNPTKHALDIILIGVLVAWTEETTGIIRPPGNAGRLHPEASHNLTSEGLPVVAHVTTPQGRAVALDAGEATAGEYE